MWQANYPNVFSFLSWSLAEIEIRCLTQSDGDLVAKMRWFTTIFLLFQMVTPVSSELDTITKIY